ncbi:MAG: DUF2155 domain-containing protein [Rickettsiales bacterium]|nr:DUF2155 domain-containing protein [Rickettsiales bacterium]
MKGRFIIIFTLLFINNISFARIEEDKTINDILDGLSDSSIEEIKEEQEEKNIAYIYDLKTDNIPNLLKRADILIDERNLDEAIDLLELINEFSIEEGLYQTQISSLLKMGNIRFFQKNNLDAIKLYEETITIINKLIEENNSEDQSLNIEITDKFPYIYTRLSYFYFKENIQMSKSYMELAIGLNEELGSIDNLAENYYNYIIILNKLNLQNQASEQQKKYDLIFAKINNHNFYKLPKLDDDNGYEYNLNTEQNKNYSFAEYANIQILNKIDGFNYKFRTKIGGKLKYRNLEIITRNCLKSSAESSPENMLLLEVNEISSKKNIFNGWMFSSSPSINSLDHSIYDLRVVNCSLTPI